MFANTSTLFFRRGETSSLALIAITVAAYAQAAHLLAFEGIAPNAAFVSIYVLSFFERRIYWLLAALLISIFFLFSPWDWLDIGSITLILATLVAVKRFFLWNNVWWAILGTLLITITPSLFLSPFAIFTSILTLMLEATLNGMVVLLVFYIFYFLKQREP